MRKLGLLFGGESTEHEISIITMFQVKAFFDEKLEFLYISKENELFHISNPTMEDFKNLKKLNKKFKKAIFVKNGFKVKFKNYKLDCMILLNHGKNGEDGLASALMQFYDIPYVGSDLFSSAVCLDKTFTHKILKASGVNVTKAVYLDKDNRIKKHPLPCIIKPARLGSSIGISIVHTQDEYDKALDAAFEYDDYVIVEELLTDFLEVDMAFYKTSEIVHSKAVVIDKDKEFFSFDDKYIAENKNGRYRYDLEEDLELEVIKQGSKAFEVLKCFGIVRIDFMIKNGKVYVNEVNSIPGGLANFLFEDFNYSLEEAIRYALISYSHNKKKVNSYENSIFSLKNLKK